MKLTRFFALIRGYSEVRIKGKTEEVLNKAGKNGIPVWSARRTGIEDVVFRTTEDGARRLKKLSLPGTEAKTERHGLINQLIKHKARFGIVIGVVLFFVTVFFSTSFIWDINIYGNEKVTSEKIMQKLGENSIGIGRMMKKVKTSDAELSLLIAFPEIKWIQIEKTGTTVNVYLAETTERHEEISLDGEITDVVASRDGIIVLCVPRNGISNVRNGESVSKGDLLISGYYMTRRNTVRSVHAEGTVTAKTVHVVETAVPYKTEEYIKTGDKKEYTSLRIFNFEIPLYLSYYDGEYETAKSETEEKRIKLFGAIELPIFVKTESFYEEVLTEITKTKENAIIEAEKIVNKLQSEQFNSIIIEDTESKLTENEDGVTYTRFLYCREDIGVVVPADMTRELHEYEI